CSAIGRATGETPEACGFESRRGPRSTPSTPKMPWVYISGDVHPGLFLIPLENTTPHEDISPACYPGGRGSLRQAGMHAVKTAPPRLTTRRRGARVSTRIHVRGRRPPVPDGTGGLFAFQPPGRRRMTSRRQKRT